MYIAKAKALIRCGNGLRLLFSHMQRASLLMMGLILQEVREQLINKINFFDFYVQLVGLCKGDNCFYSKGENQN